MKITINNNTIKEKNEFHCSILWNFIKSIGIFLNMLASL